jgi:hypothetical protein
LPALSPTSLRAYVLQTERLISAASGAAFVPRVLE